MELGPQTKKPQPGEARMQMRTQARLDLHILTQLSSRTWDLKVVKETVSLQGSCLSIIDSGWARQALDTYCGVFNEILDVLWSNSIII